MKVCNGVMPQVFCVALALSLLGSVAVLAISPARTGKTHHAPKPAPAKMYSANGILTNRASSKAGAAATPLDPDEAQIFSQYAEVSSRSLDIAKAGDAAAKQGNWKAAGAYYQQALDLWPDNSDALYGLGKYADAAGDTASAVRYYRTATYADNSPHTKWNTQTNDVARLMEFVLLLSKAGQEPEARAVYSRAAHLLNYRDADTNEGKPYLKVLLPEFDNSSNAIPYTPQRLQAMARVAIAIEAGAFGSKDALPQVQEAVRLYPDSPITYFYLGEQLKLRQKKEAKAAYQKAATLGDDQVGTAVQEELKIYH